jgi:hypothetical protein
MKTKVITTLHRDGYELYGENLKTWVKNFPAEWKIDYYAENHNPLFDKRINVKNFHECCPEWNNFYQHIKSHTDSTTNKKQLNWYKKTLRWSFKMFVILHSLKNSDDTHLIWLDSDVIAKSSPPAKWITTALKNSCMAGKLEKIKNKSHIESGILIFDKTHPDITKIEDWINLGYTQKKILNEHKAWDGFWLGKLTQTNSVSWNNINLFDKQSWLIHQVGDEKFSSKYSGRSGRQKDNELI